MLHSLQNLAVLTWREPLSDESKKLLQAIFKALPEQQRADFLTEIYQSMEERGRQAFWRRTREAAAPTASQEIPESNATQTEPPNASSAVRGVTAPEEAATSGDADTIGETNHRQTLHRGIEEFNRFKHQMSREGHSDMKRQLWSCLGLGILALGALALMGMGGEYVYSLFKSWWR